MTFTQTKHETSTDVTDYLSHDHRRLDALLTEVLRLAKLGEGARADQVYAEFASGLDRHIDLEEQLLFPVFEEHTGSIGGPTGVMRAEHVMIRRCLTDIRTVLATRDAAALAASVDELVDVLGPHNVKEERILYPMSDRLIGQLGATDLVRRMQAT